jgi:hypothetical protein
MPRQASLGRFHTPPNHRNINRLPKYNADLDYKDFFLGGGDFLFFAYYIQHCFICRPSDSTVPTDAGIEPRTFATGALASDSLTTRLDLIRLQRLDTQMKGVF